MIPKESGDEIQFLIQVTTEPLIFSGFYPEALSFG
ncbi:hypothetical protein SEEPBA42_11089 [Salmonella enterica subsp. enterica serovar Paratyphi B str. SARA42]|nr:hypothetical protein SEEPBA42_11089 [Salmonella enterica subsp. enterica serovar Paratyphi B str. SARA42]